jgi:hypothetical protein
MKTPKTIPYSSFYGKVNAKHYPMILLLSIILGKKEPFFLLITPSFVLNQLDP